MPPALNPPQIEFRLGCAGAGKTHGCIADIAEELRDGGRGAPRLLQSPEQATAQMERRLAVQPGLDGFTRARVLSFNHLAREAFARSGGRPARMLGELGRLMLLRRALLRVRERMQIFRPGPGGLELIQGLDAALLEFQRYGWRPADLAVWIESAGGESSRREPMLARKLADLRLLWETYLELLADGGWSDPAGREEHAAAAVARWDALGGVRVWVDGFASFTEQEVALLEALLGHAREAAIALCVDPAAIVRAETKGAPRRLRLGPERLFENAEETFHLLRARFEGLGWPTRLRTLPEAGAPTRYSGAPALAHLERAVLDRIDPVTFGGTAAETEAALELVEATDRRAEIEAVARRIVALHAGEGKAGHRWRECALLARDLRPYEALVRAVFPRYGIPFFLDRPREVEGHPLARLILTALALARGGWRGDLFIQHLKSGLCGLEDETLTAALENRILAIDTRGRGWLDALRQDARLAPALVEAAEPLAAFERRLAAGEPPARALWTLIEAVGASRRVEQWIEAARAAGDEEEAMLHEQAWEQTVGWIEALDEVGENSITITSTSTSTTHDARRTNGGKGQVELDELGALAEAGLGATRARLIPPTLDQVMVGTVDRSRTPEIRALFVLGLNEREFPRLWTPDPILGDEERARLTAPAGGPARRLAPDTRRRHLHEHFLGYIALTRARERLVLLRPLRDEEGKATDPSPLLRRVATAFPDAPVALAGRAAEGDRPDLPLRADEWALRLTAAGDGAENPQQAARLLALMAAGDPLDRPELDEAERRALADGRARALAPPAAPLDPAVVREFWGLQRSVSVTALEELGACPFRFFSARMLGLAEREAWPLSPLDLGSVRHRVLEKIFERFGGARGLNWGELDLDQAREVIDAELRAWAAEPGIAPRTRASAFLRLQLSALARQLALAVAALRAAGKRMAFRQVAAERSFGGPGDPWTIEAGGLSLPLAGKIDRVDIAGEGGRRACILFDYKSGARRARLGRVLVGAELQLLTYGLAWSRLAEGTGDPPPPVLGVFYWPLFAPVRAARRGGECDPEIDADWFRNCGPGGLFDETIAGLLDAEAGPGDKALAFGFSRNRDGRLAKRGRGVLPAGTLARLLDLEARLLEDHLARIASGAIAPSPIADGSWIACDTCAWTPLCRRHELDRMQARVVPKVNAELLAAHLDRVLGEEAP